MDQLGDNTFGYQCHYSSYCSKAQQNLEERNWSGLRSQNSNIYLICCHKFHKIAFKTVTEITVSALVGYVPSNTSIELEVSNDGGTTWISGIFNQKLIFSNPGSSIV